MILEKLQTLALHGAERPLSLWSDDERVLAHELQKDVHALMSKIPNGTEAERQLQTLQSLLNEESPNDFLLASALLYVAEIFRKNPPKVGDDRIHEYITHAKQFYTRAQITDFHDNLRSHIKQIASPDDQKAQDRRLFEHEGMIYCLEYYLVVYKAIADAPSEREKLAYIDPQAINLGTGDLPGLRADFATDEVLTKFVYKILADAIREHLEREIYAMKSILEQSASSTEIQKALQRFLLVLIQAFQDVGIKHLSSFFFTPYGEEALLNDVSQKIQQSL